MVNDYVPRKPRKRRKPSSEVIEVRPAVVLCEVCNHLKYKEVKHVNGSSYRDDKRCLNCPTCKAARTRVQHATVGT